MARGGRKHFLTRMISGLASLRAAKEAEPVRARVADAGVTDTNAVTDQPAVSDAFLKLATERLKLNSLMYSARPSAVIHNGESSRYVAVGETIPLNTADGRAEFRVERIEPTKVTLVEVKSGAELVLRMKN